MRVYHYKERFPVLLVRIRFVLRVSFSKGIFGKFDGVAPCCETQVKILITSSKKMRICRRQ